MSFITLLFGLGGQQSTIGTLTLDALLSEDTDLTSNVSRYPAEEGSPITDNITLENEKLSLSGKVTGAGVLLLQGLGPSKLIAAKQTLRQLYAARTPIVVMTGGDLYENMAITNLRISRNNTAEALFVDAELQQIRVVSTRRADIPPEKVKGGAAGKAGTTRTPAGKVSSTAGADADAPTVNQSILDRWILGKQQLPSLGGLQ